MIQGPQNLEGARDYVTLGEHGRNASQFCEISRYVKSWTLSHLISGTIDFFRLWQRKTHQSVEKHLYSSLQSYTV